MHNGIEAATRRTFQQQLPPGLFLLNSKVDMPVGQRCEKGGPEGLLEGGFLAGDAPQPDREVVEEPSDGDLDVGMLKVPA